MFQRIPAGDARILLADPDPYLAFLLRQEFPAITIEESYGTITPPGPTDVVIAEADDPDEVAGMFGGAQVIGVVDATKMPQESPESSAHTLVRPFLPSEVHRTVRAALGLPGVRSGTRAASRARWLIAGLRILAVIIAGLIAASGTRPVDVEMLASVSLYVIVRTLLRRGRLGVIVDVGLAAFLVAMTGGAHSVYAPLALVAVVGAGYETGPWAGAGSGLLLASFALQEISRSLEAGRIGPMEAGAWFGLFFFGGFTGGLAARFGLGPHHGSTMLVEANRNLSNLYQIARAMPGGLEPRIIADSVLGEVKDLTAAPAAAMLVRQVGTFAVAGSYGVTHPRALAGAQWDLDLAGILDRALVMNRTQLPPATAAAWQGLDCFIAAPIRRDSTTFGVLLCACPDHAMHARNKAVVARLAQECAVAVENAELFARVREMSIDEERQRLARDLHDGVAQAIMHLRLELDLLARRAQQTPAFSDDLVRLGRVVQRAGSDIRETILGLRSPVATEGLVAALRSYTRDLRRFGGPEIEFTATGTLRPGPRVEAEVFRFAQEALSNAIRHSQARRIEVALALRADGLTMKIADDGIGFDAARPSDGVGLHAMRERAARLGGLVTFATRDTGGTLIELTCPIREEEIV